MIKIGSFEVKSGTVVVSDPCYDLGTWCQAVLENVLNGEWRAYVRQSDEGSWGIRNAELVAYHSAIREPRDYEWIHLSDKDIGVDSGQAGFYDIDVFKNDDVAKESTFLSAERQKEKGEKWYSACCELTLRTEEKAGVMEGGVVSTSGYGDGGYDLYIVRDSASKVVALRLVFISDEDHCEGCGEFESECCCEECYHCGEKEYDCECEYCDECGEHTDDCECEEDEE